MARRAVLMGCLLGCLVLGRGMAWAGEDQGHLCWVLQGLIDRVVADVQTTDGGPPALFSLPAVRWVAPALYELAGTGSAFVKSEVPIGQIQVGLLLSNPSTFFGNNAMCASTLTLNPPPSLNGTWKITCTGQTTPGFSSSGSVLFDADCDGLVPSLSVLSREAGGTAAGEGSR